MGFFGGVAWAIVTARVCQLYPNAAPAAIVSKFFRIMNAWQWPQPVILRTIEDSASLRVWNPKIYPQDKSHRMPIITPSFPSMCSTHNVTNSTRDVTVQEFGDAADVVDHILIGAEKEGWEALFTKHDFFHRYFLYTEYRYKWYIQVIASSDNADEHLKWSGLVESRLRQLVNKLEIMEEVLRAHPFIKGFERMVVCENDIERQRIAHGDLPLASAPGTAKSAASVVESTNVSSVAGKTLPGMHISPSNNTIMCKLILVNSIGGMRDDLGNKIDPSAEAVIGAAPEAAAGPKAIWTSIFYIGLLLEPKDPASGDKRQLDISWHTTEFQKLVKSWDMYDDSRMMISIRCIKK